MARSAPPVHSGAPSRPDGRGPNGKGRGGQFAPAARNSGQPPPARPAPNMSRHHRHDNSRPSTGLPLPSPSSTLVDGDGTPARDDSRERRRLAGRRLLRPGEAGARLRSGSSRRLPSISAAPSALASAGGPRRPRSTSPQSVLAVPCATTAMGPRSVGHREARARRVGEHRLAERAASAGPATTEPPSSLARAAAASASAIQKSTLQWAASPSPACAITATTSRDTGCSGTPPT